MIETAAHNGIETYRPEVDGMIDTVVAFNHGSFAGPAKRDHPRGFVVDRVNQATWARQFLRPCKAEFLIAYLNADYAQTVIGRNPRDDVRILARTPAMPAADDQRLPGELAAQGDDLGKRRKVPQRWPGQNQPPLPAGGGTGAATILRRPPAAEGVPRRADQNVPLRPKLQSEPYSMRVRKRATAGVLGPKTLMSSGASARLRMLA